MSQDPSDFESDLSYVPDFKIPNISTIRQVENQKNTDKHGADFGPPPFDFAMNARKAIEGSKTSTLNQPAERSSSPDLAQDKLDSSKLIDIGMVDDFDYILKNQHSAKGLTVKRVGGIVEVNYRPRFQDMLFASSVGKTAARREFIGSVSKVSRTNRLSIEISSQAKNYPSNKQAQIFRGVNAVKNSLSYLFGTDAVHKIDDRINRSRDEGEPLVSVESENRQRLIDAEPIDAIIARKQAGMKRNKSKME